MLFIYLANVWYAVPKPPAYSIILVAVLVIIVM